MVKQPTEWSNPSTWVGSSSRANSNVVEPRPTRVGRPLSSSGCPYYRLPRKPSSSHQSRSNDNLNRDSSIHTNIHMLETHPTSSKHNPKPSKTISKKSPRSTRQVVSRGSSNKSERARSCHAVRVVRKSERLNSSSLNTRATTSIPPPWRCFRGRTPPRNRGTLCRPTSDRSHSSNRAKCDKRTTRRTSSTKIETYTSSVRRSSRIILRRRVAYTNSRVVLGV